MTWQTRASLRATGQLGMLAAAVNMTVSTAELFVRQVLYTGVWPLGWSQLRFYLSMAVSVALALIALQASSHTDSDPRHRRAALLSSALAVALAVAAIATPLPGGRSALGLLTSLISELVWPLGAAACLALSYRGQPLGLGGPGALRPRSPWLWKIAAPLAGIDLLAVALEEHDYLPETLVIGVLATGLGYGLMRRRDRKPGGRWASATWPLIALAVPSYLLNLATSLGSGLLIARHSLAAATAAIILVAVLGLHLTHRHRDRPALAGAPTQVGGGRAADAGGTGPVRPGTLG